MSNHAFSGFKEKTAGRFSKKQKWARVIKMALDGILFVVFTRMENQGPM
jgi:hypothetical protein